MATTRKILSKGITPISGSRLEMPKKESEKEIKEIEELESGEEKKSAPRLKKVCQFCSNKTEPHYFDIVALRRFINDRGRIVTRVRSGSCAKHQRRITKEIKRARHLALLPFTVRV